jgi:hypothetical protein
MGRPPAQAHDGQKNNPDPDREVQVDKRLGLRVAPHMRHGPGDAELHDQHDEDRPMQKFRQAGIAGTCACLSHD